MNQTQTRSPRKRWLSLLLAVVLVVGLLPISAFASNVGTQADDSGTTAESQEFMRIFHLDCGRKYFSVSEIEGIIDQLAKNHYTHIQLAFGNDGLRFLLDDMSVTVNGTEHTHKKVSDAVTSGNSTYSSSNSTANTMLTQSDMDDIIKHANDKGIQVIPMFNSPYHMDALLNAMENLGISDARKKLNNVNRYLNLESANAVAFVKALQQKYMDYFKSKGCEYYNIATDEYAFDHITDAVYTEFAEYVNALAGMVKDTGMTPLAYNDGFYWKTRTSSVDFDTDIVICYWSNGGNRASAEDLIGKHYKILNNNDSWYYVLGDALSAWKNPQWRYKDAVAAIPTVPVTQIKGYSGSTLPVGSVLCCWCDYPSKSYPYTSNDNKTGVNDVYALIALMAESNPGYFKEYTAPQPELKVDTANAQGVTVSATKGNYQVILPEDTEGATLTVQLSMENLAEGQTAVWSSDKEEIATVGANTGLVTFTGTTGTVTITAQPQSSTNADEATGTYEVTFEVKAAGELAVKEITVQEGRTYDVTLSGNLVDDVKSLINDYVQVDAAYNQTEEYELQAVTEIVSGEQYLIVNQRLAQSKNEENQLLTSGSATWEGKKGLSLSGTPSTNSKALWTITTSGSGYTVQYNSTETNDYLNIGDNTASVSGTKAELTLSYKNNDAADGYPSKYWSISSGNYYLNNLGNEKCAGGWKYVSSENNANTDVGSRWTLYRIVEKTAADTTTVTFTGLQVGTTSVTIGDTTYRITVTEKKLVEIPITIIDYRADGLLFDYNYYNHDSYAYGLVHVRSGNGYYDNLTGKRGDILDGSQYGTKIAGTTLERTRDSDSYAYWGDNNVLDNSWSRAGLVEEKLGINGMPEYTKATIEYVASLLAAGNYNDVSSSSFSCNTVLQDTFLKETSPRSVLSTDTTSMTGFSDAFKDTRSYANITNAYDLAWYLLNNLYVADTNMTTVTGTDGKEHEVPIYGMAVDAYNSIVLTDNGKGVYSFEAGYSGSSAKVSYDRDARTISNSGDEERESFYPLEDLGYEQPGLLKNTSKIDARHNGSFTLRGESQFVYNSKASLYFTFTGDDDVYMYINGVLALDLGGAHGRNTKTVNLNEVATKCGLVDGEVATFTFFYMERCSDASTFGIETNMELVQRDIDVQKNAYSDSQYTSMVNSGEAVSNKSTVYYDLVVSNQGNTSMTNISISDTDSFGGSACLGDGQTAAVTPSKADENKSLVSLGEQGYTYFIVDKDGNKGTSTTCSTLEELSKAVAGLMLEGGAQLHIRFLTAKVDVAESKIISYTNTLNVTAVSGGKELSDSAIHTIYSYNAGGTDKTYVVDFGLPLRITGIFDVTAKEYIDENTNAIKLNGHPKYGDVTEFESKGMETSMVYKLNAKTTIDGQDTITLNVPYKFGNTSANLDKNIYIIPASNVYYEDNLATFTDGAGSAAEAKWEPVGTATSEQQSATQALEELGKHKNAYGYDDAYNSSSKLSMGTAHKVTVTPEMLKNWKNDANSAWPTASFTFTGTGFDIISLTDNTSGAILVSVTGKDYNKNFLVDNYYGYDYDEATGEWKVVNDGSKNALYQIPVMKVDDLDYGTYNVTIQVFYHEFFDVTANDTDGYNFWLDAIRIYNPMGKDYDYTADNEGYPQYILIHDELVKTDETGGFVFIDGAKEATIGQYANYGPNNEVYLAYGQAITFMVPENGQIASIQIGAKAPDGKANMVVKDGTGVEQKDQEINTATEMYYKISENSGQFTVTNTGSSILSLTNLKITYKDKDHKEVTLESLTAEEQANAVAMVQALFAAPVETFQPERFEASWGGSVRVGRKATLTVKTSEDVDAITVDGVTISSYTTRTERTGWGWWSPKVTYRVFTYTTTATATADYQVCAVNSAGISSEPVIATLTVRPATWWNWWF